MDFVRVAKRGLQPGSVEMRTESAVSTSAWLIGALSLGLGAGTAIGVLAYGLKTTNASYGQPGQNMQPGAGSSLHIVLYEPINKWKDTLLRGQHSEWLGKYSDQFRTATTSVTEMSVVLRSAVPDAAARRLSEQLLRAKASVHNNYEAARKGLTAVTAGNARETDQTWKGEGLAATNRISEAVLALAPRADAGAASQMDLVIKRTWVMSLAVLAVFALIATLVGFAVPEIFCILRRVAGSWVSSRRAPRAPLPLLDMVPTVARLEFPEV